MGRCDRRCLAIGIKRSLSKIDKMIVKEAMKMEVDALMYEFARLHGIGVISDEISNSTTLYTFLSDPESRIDTGFRMKLVFANHSVNVNWDTVNGSYLDRALKQVTIYLNLRNWEEYLEEDLLWPGPNDLVSKKVHDDMLDAMRYSRAAVIPRTRMLDLTTGGPGREALERMLRTSQYDVDVASMCPKLSDNILNYMKKDVESTMDLYKRMEEKKKNTIKKVIFHDPATIIYWEDGTKTVVKVQNGEKFDPEKGMAMAICKKTHGNDGSYYEAFKKFLPKEEKKTFEFSFDLPEGVDEPTEGNVETPMDLEECTDAVTIDTEAEQYTGEAPKEVSDCNTLINLALAAFVEDVGCLEALYDPERGVYYVRNKNNFVKPPYELKVDSPIAEISPTALTQLKLDICKYFDI